ncbi:hypothetical protein MKW94_015959 [Papaver nudicaule]|uniref:SHSP domain-containing protein n=1 Tax=Papaver nudicaule TaxID=74823 RepID=A0AA41RUS9_PAPNU|nr:hypothetical protein [Papaver nudicaule]
MGNSFVFLIDLNGKEIFGNEIKVKEEGDRTLVITYDHYDEYLFQKQEKSFDLPLNANMDAVSAVSHNGTLLVTVNKVNRRRIRERTIKITKVES